MHSHAETVLTHAQLQNYLLLFFYKKIMLLFQKLNSAIGNYFKNHPNPLFVSDDQSFSNSFCWFKK